MNVTVVIIGNMSINLLVQTPFPVDESVPIGHDQAYSKRQVSVKYAYNNQGHHSKYNLILLAPKQVAKQSA